MSRVKRLAEETPATFMVFDLLQSGRRDLAILSLMKRRAALEKLSRHTFRGRRHLSSVTGKPQLCGCRGLAQHRE
ncbi:hypothetical protein [Bradyrhizobium erythrophlei]|uniref:hypothetical protein n=1 Tax=Bradyrhizobium erythrophlei TaxID=1437360 RepID=UPI0030B8310B